MPLIDKPLEQLRTYRGINPRPEDFDAYWATSLDEMRGVAADVELRQFVSLSTQTAECFDLTFTGIGGARIYAKYLRPKRIVKPGPAVVQFHGYS
ncbi:MAG TPA: acetylxylan esterase, partial [Opitutaceae bacterium]|nr:acetylxylan esterase [Opitutaceae bacterium]